ncbi:MAG: PspC domain-containing protein [Acidimicrobiales bacterium]
MDAPSDLGSPGPARPPGPTDPSPGPRGRRRRPDDGPIAGVCAGVAEYFDVDPVVVRIAAVVLAVSGPGVIAYVLAWIFVPAAPGTARYGEPRAPIDTKDRATQIFGIVLLALGVSVIWGDWWSPLHGWLFPLGLMALGAWLLLRPDREDDRADHRLAEPVVPPVPPAPATAGWTPATTATLSVGAEGALDAGASEDAAATDVASDDADPGLDATVAEPTDGDATTVQPPLGAVDGDSGGDGWGAPPTAPWDVPPPPAPDGPPSGGPERHGAARHRHGRLVGPGVFGVLLIWTGIAWLAGVGLTTGLAVGLVILGLGFVLGSFVGGSRWLVLPALLVAIALAISALVDIPLSGPIGEQRWSPDSLEELQDTYEVSMGEGTLDLTELGLLSSDQTVRATVGLGHLVVLVPVDQDLLVDTDVGAGDALVFGEEQNGLGFETHDAYHGTSDGTLTLDLEVGMGQIEVRHAASDRRDEPVDRPDPVGSPEPTTPSTLG